MESRTDRVKKLNKELKKLYPEAKTALTFKNEWELLVKVQLSAQSTDKKVNEMTPTVFKKYKNIKGFAEANIKELEKDLSFVLYYRNKAKNIKAAAEYLIENHKGKLPKTMEELLHIPGVARKTGNVLLSTLFDIHEGITVDTHVIRFSRRFGLTDYKDAVKIEKDLMDILPKKDWKMFSYMIIDYGRSYGNPKGKRELHEQDPLLKFYPKAKNYWP